jgi:micrococcal nuclease
MGCIISKRKKRLSIDERYNMSRLQGCTLENTPMFNLYGPRECKVIDVYDGDTITIALFNDNKCIQGVRCRLSGIDTPEIRTKNREEKEKGLKAKEFLAQLVLGKIIWVHCHKPDKYGRILAELYLNKEAMKEGFSINNLLVDKGYAVKYDGKTKNEF